MPEYTKIYMTVEKTIAEKVRKLCTEYHWNRNKLMRFLLYTEPSRKLTMPPIDSLKMILHRAGVYGRLNERVAQEIMGLCDKGEETRLK